jgi:predicted enzyme related to lactoylglutathione lyase
MSENNLRIDYIEFVVSDMEESKKFYGDVFGWEFTDYGPDYCSFSDGRLAGGLTTQGSVVKGGPLVVFYADKLEDTESAIVSSGGNVTKEIFSFPGGRRFQFTDPSGNELAVWSDA